MARRGQVGRIEVMGKWYTVRFWRYPKDGKPIRVREKICPVSGPGYLPSGARRRRATEIVEQSGVNDAQQFRDDHVSTTFREQAEWFFTHAEQRGRRPVKPKTLQTWKYAANKWLYPALGDLPLAQVDNATVKPLVAKMLAAGCSAQTIHAYVGLVKLIVASKVGEKGEQLFPRQWNHDFLDIPIIGKQHRPMFDAATIKGILDNSAGQDRVLYALLAGTGLRIGEALGLEIRHLSQDRRTIRVEQSVWEGRVQTPKTENAYRQIDICPALADLLKQHVGDRRDGFVFRNGEGNPLLPVNVMHRSLHPILDKLEVPRAGFHAFRRWRITHLRRSRVPEDLIRFWVGQAAKSVTDIYSQVSADLEFRLSVAAEVGVGFEVPALIGPNGPKIEAENDVEVAA
jgi:integrase